MNPSLFKGELGFLKNHRRGDQVFLVKMSGGGSPYRDVVNRKGLTLLFINNIWILQQ